MRSQIEIIREAARSGCQFIQIREKDLPARQLCEFTRDCLTAVRPYGTKVLVNDRVDVAFASGADGVHLRVSSLPADEVRGIALRQGLNDFLIGVSTHSLDEARAAASTGADFVVCGPVFDTPSKKAFGPPLGLDRLAEICQAIEIPLLALGGIDLSNYQEALNRGAAGVAAIKLFSDPQTIKETIATIFKNN